jgi:hypothetical protein
MNPGGNPAVAAQQPQRAPIHRLLTLVLPLALFFIPVQRPGGRFAVETLKSDSNVSPPFRLRPLGSLPWGYLKHASSVTASEQDSPANADITVHEWGTFTSISGSSGQAIDWLPLTGSTDLPSFVEHLRESSFKGGLHGTIRMETPVLYFYSPRETTVSVKVSFAKGLITEWYPHSNYVAASNPRTDFSLDQMRSAGGITWNCVHIEPARPANFPREDTENHYYAARETSSAPLRVPTPAGDQQERFLFYRGVSAVTPLISAILTANGTVVIRRDTASARNVAGAQEQTTPGAITEVILFERRGDRVGYTILGPLHDEAALVAPTLDGYLESLFSHLEGLLISQGLFPEEAHAMLETWKNSWFEEGSRLFYIVPRNFLDSVLPLSISPAPVETTRVFLGRLELITPATEQDVESAFASGDSATLAKYSRFLEPILVTMMPRVQDPATFQRMQNYLQNVYRNLSANKNAHQNQD